MFEQAFKNIDDVLWKDAGCTSELDYTEQTSWLLFLKYLNALESDRDTAAALNGKAYSHILDEPYHWDSWAAPNNKTSPSAPARRRSSSSSISSKSLKPVDALAS